MQMAALQITQQTRSGATNICFISVCTAWRLSPGPQHHLLALAQSWQGSLAQPDNKCCLFIYEDWNLTGLWHILQGQSIRVPFPIFSLPLSLLDLNSLCLFSLETCSSQTLLALVVRLSKFKTKIIQGTLFFLLGLGIQVGEADGLSPAVCELTGQTHLQMLRQGSYGKSSLSWKLVK